MNIVTRFAPSPTGYFHAGSYRTALFSYIFAKQNNGKFILRIEDTDKERSKKEYEENILESLEWLGLKYDEFYRQSERTELYKKYIQKLIDSGNAYVSDEGERKSRIATSTAGSASRPLHKRQSEALREFPLTKGAVERSETGGMLSSADRNKVIRFKNPNKKVAFNDLVRGHVEFDTTELGDFVIAKSMDEPIFHLVNVVDDHEMGITHIIRGEDHISNTPRQILIFEAIGAKPPEYAHIPLLLAKDRSKLSKRNGAVPITEYRQKGYLAEAVVNYLALLGWHPADDRECIPLDDIMKEFSLDRVQKSGAIFDEEKLAWYNRQYLAKLSNDGFSEQSRIFIPEWLGKGSQLFARLLPLVREKISFFGEMPLLFSSNGELAFTKALPEYKPELLLWKKNPDTAAARTHLDKSIELISKVNADEFTADRIKEAIWSYAEANGKGDVLWPLRAALTGQERSPDPFQSAYILGKEETLKRIKIAVKKLT